MDVVRYESIFLNNLNLFVQITMNTLPQQTYPDLLEKQNSDPNVFFKQHSMCFRILWAAANHKQRILWTVFSLKRNVTKVKKFALCKLY